MSYAIGPDNFMFAFSQDNSVQECFSVNSDMHAMIGFEKALTSALGRYGVITLESMQHIIDVLERDRKSVV